MLTVLSDYLIYVVLIGIMIFFSFFFSGVETAVITASRIRLEHLAKTGNAAAGRALALLDDLDETVGMILIGNNVVNIAATSFITYLATTAFVMRETGLFVVTAVQTMVFLIACELTPKVISRAHAESFLMLSSYPVKLLLAVMKPAVKLSLLFSGFLKRMFNVTESSRAIVRSREEIDTMFKIGEEEGVIDREHHVYVSEILSFKDIIAREIMTPTIDIVSVELNKSIRELVDVFVATRFTRIPVYESRVDNILGYVFYRDILRRRSVKNIADIMNKAHYVPTTKRIAKLYTEMTENRIPLVFVVNEYGAVVGMVTHEDIAEEVVGEIQTRDQSGEGLITELGRNRYLLKGRLDIEYFMRRFKVQIEKKGFETLSGFVAYRMGKIPRTGDRFEYDKYTFIVEEATDRSIEKIILQKRKKRRRISGQP
ncbi:MAG: hypothetical protein A2176_10665 [Spirochaetes bacterium RBG_13_51_14]|nr:MAG: hypothetical protein A2176_10665 [Spirochaetes bacterium RBG_13_51_14]